MPRPWNIQGRRLSTSESSKCKDQSLGERKWTQAQATLLGFGDKKDKGGKMEETDMIISRNIYWPGMYVGATTWRAPEPFLIVLWCLVFHQTSILLGLFLVWFAWVFFCFYIYITSQKSPMLWRKEIQGFDQALPHWQRVEPRLNYSRLGSNMHSRGEQINPKRVILASHFPPQPELQLASGRLQVQRNAKNWL